MGILGDKAATYAVKKAIYDNDRKTLASYWDQMDDDERGYVHEAYQSLHPTPTKSITDITAPAVDALKQDVGETIGALNAPQGKSFTEDLMGHVLNYRSGKEGLGDLIMAPTNKLVDYGVETAVQGAKKMGQAFNTVDQLISPAFSPETYTKPIERAGGYVTRKIYEHRADEIEKSLEDEDHPLPDDEIAGAKAAQMEALKARAQIPAMQDQSDKDLAKLTGQVKHGMELKPVEAQDIFSDEFVSQHPNVAGTVAGVIPAFNPLNYTPGALESLSELPGKISTGVDRMVANSKMAKLTQAIESARGAAPEVADSLGVPNALPFDEGLEDLAPRSAEDVRPYTPIEPYVGPRGDVVVERPALPDVVSQGARAQVMDPSMASPEDIQQFAGTGLEGDRSLSEVIVPNRDILRQPGEYEARMPNLSVERRGTTYPASGRYVQPEELTPAGDVGHALSPDRDVIALPERMPEARPPLLLEAPKRPQGAVAGLEGVAADHLGPGDASAHLKAWDAIKDAPTSEVGTHANYLPMRDIIDHAPVGAPELDMIASPNFENLSAQAYREGLELEPSFMERTKRFMQQQVGDVGKRVAREPGGGKIYQAAEEGVQYRQHLINSGRSLREGVEKEMAKLPKREYRQMSERLFDALSDRGNAASYLKTDLDRRAYKAYQDFWDLYKQEMENHGFATKEDYATHVRDFFEKPGDNTTPSVYQRTPEEIKSGFFKERTGNGRFEKADIMKTARVYEGSVSRALAYQPALDAYANAPKSTVVDGFLRGILFPERVDNVLMDPIAKARFNVYVRYNPWSALSNLSQKDMARLRVTPDAVKLAGLIGDHREELGLKSFLEGLLSSRSEDVMGKVAKEAPDAYELYMRSEETNWRASRALGVAQEVLNHPGYQEAIKGGARPLDAVKAILNERAVSKANGSLLPETVLERAKIRGQNLASETQFINEPGFKPTLFEKGSGGLLKLPLQFRRFGLSTLEATLDSFTNAGKEATILRRGFEDEASVVERLNALRITRKGAISLRSQYPERAKELTGLIKETSEDIASMEALVNKIEPRNAARSFYYLTSMSGKQFGVKAARLWAKWALASGGAIYGAKKVTDKQKASALKRSAIQSLPGVEGLSTGMDLAQGLGSGDTVPKSWADAGVDLAELLAMPVGIVDTMIPGKPISTSIKNWIKKKKLAKKAQRQIQEIPEALEE